MGYLSANRYFVSFMSGNTTRLATDFVKAPASALVPALLIAGGYHAAKDVGVPLHLADLGAEKPLVVMLTTAGMAAWAAWLKLPATGSVCGVEGACSSTRPVSPKAWPRCSQAGCRVAITKYSASSTVTVWAKRSQ